LGGRSSCSSELLASFKSHYNDTTVQDVRNAFVYFAALFACLFCLFSLHPTKQPKQEVKVTNAMSPNTPSIAQMSSLKESNAFLQLFSILRHKFRTPYNAKGQQIL
jgi:hypothetical protein